MSSERQQKLRDLLAKPRASGLIVVPEVTDKYFSRSVDVLKHAKKNPIVTMQIFGKKGGIVAGLTESIHLLNDNCKPKVKIYSLIDGDEVKPWETVMLIKGPYTAFAELETPVLGVIARRSLVATNAHKTVQAANGKPVMFMGARHDDWRNQRGDGYAALLGGCDSVSTDTNGILMGVKGSGTMPHALIAAFDGDTVAAALAYKKWLKDTGQNLPLTVLVDYDNYVSQTSLDVCRAVYERFGELPYAVRLDTSENLVDHGMPTCPDWGRTKPTGVNIPLVLDLRKQLDFFGYEAVRIVVSGGFNPKKIAEFEAAGAPVDLYGVGSSIIGHNHGEGGLYTSFDFTGDIVEVDGRSESKVGRCLSPNPRLVEVKF